MWSRVFPPLRQSAHRRECSAHPGPAHRVHQSVDTGRRDPDPSRGDATPAYSLPEARLRLGQQQRILGRSRALAGAPGAEADLNPRRDISSWLARWFPRTPARSVVALKTPIKVELVAGKTYRWCVCGRSKKQPFCDGSHFFQRTGLSPLKFKAQETRTVALCTCKATQRPPYCDGTHRSERVQKAEVGSPL
ncbi:PREDICTED: CDGSH iron-sulfur domain-containing protein 3, mitochondrial [Mandrillus leucophaeus]|nr:PREDICTED: CDGSH iron-sulfur domain-containing protein 3, mitochondrial [Mandrillus leucophaeus]